jgi:predicted DNA-binding transcriptional regulator AlpA
MSEIYLSREKAAEYLAVSVKTLERLASDGGGPAFVQIAKRRVVYIKSDIDAWAASRRYRSIAHRDATAKESDGGL